MAQAAVKSRWQAEMKEFFEDVNNAPDQDFVQLTEVFNLGDQLTSATLPKNER
jgi:L-rhamnose mutarotase